MREKKETRPSIEQRGPHGFALNRAVAWCGFFLGAATGSVMGLWSFDGPVSPPAGLTNYGDTSRRLLRLGHIAFFGIGYLNLMLAAELPSLSLGETLKRAAARSMNMANVFLPITLMAAALVAPVKYLLPVPATALTVSLALAAVGAFRRAYPAPQPYPESAKQTL